MSSFSFDKGSLGFIKEELKIGEGQFTQTYHYFKLRARHIAEEHRIGGSPWHLILYPTGSQKCREPTLSVYLGSPDFPKHCIPGTRVKMWITLLNFTCPAKQETKSTFFTLGDRKGNTEWGFDRFIALSKLMNRREGWLGPDGELKLQVKIQLFANEKSVSKPTVSSEPINTEKIRYMESLIIKNSGLQLTPKDIPVELTCPITMELMTDPVMLIESGQIYDRHAIEGWLIRYCTDPATNVQIVDKTLKPVYRLRSMCQQWKENLNGSILNRKAGGQEQSVLDQYGEIRRLGNVLQQLMNKQQSKIFKLVESMKKEHVSSEVKKEIYSSIDQVSSELFEDLVKLGGVTRSAPLPEGEKSEEGRQQGNLLGVSVTI